MSEKELVLKKTYKCPICDSAFKNLTVKQGKAYKESADMDLKVNYKRIEPLKYDIIMCPVCGYAALDRYFEHISPFQRKVIIDNVCQSFISIKDDRDELSFEDALERYYAALTVARLKMSKQSEIGFLCLKLGWLYRSYSRSLPDEETDKKDELWKLEREYLNKALENLEKAREKEQSPICGMDEITLDILLASLCVELRFVDNAKKYLNFVISNRSSTSRAKNKVFELKEIIKEIEEDYEDYDDYHDIYIG